MERLLIVNANELVTCAGGAPKKGLSMNDLAVIENGAVVVENGQITAVGATEHVLKSIATSEFTIIDARGKCVLPGFIDSHTHFVFAGHRAEEFSWRLRGVSYMDIMERGGGIVNTVRATRLASKEQLKQLASQRLDNMLAMGVTTVEGKSGYGLDRDTELKQLAVMAELNAEHPMDIVATFMGAHAIPMEYKEQPDQFIHFLITEVLPLVAEKHLADFCDVFCERGVFSIEQSKKLLRAAKELGCKIKLHADEIVPLGGAELAAELGAVSADHLLHASEVGLRRMAEAGVIATLLPATAFSLQEPYASGRWMIDQGLAVALATDFNPGSCFTESIPLVIALAAIHMKLTPAEIVTALTINAAAAVGRIKDIGSIEVGKQGDIIILEYPSHLFLPYRIGTNIVETVIKKGTVVWQKGR